MDDFDIHAPQLAGGISQQPKHLRFPGQVEDAENVDFSVEDGIRKRPGSQWVFRVTGLSSGENYRLHPIERDASEHYLMIYGSEILKIFSTAGTAATITDVSTAGAADDYFDDNAATADQMRVVTVADTTIIANTTVPLAAAATATYAVTGEWKNYERMRSHTPADGTYHRTLTDSTGYPAGYYYYDSGDSTTFAVATFNTVSATAYSNPGGSWDNAGYHGFRIRFKRRTIASSTGWTWTQSTKRLTKAASDAFDDYIWQYTDEVEITDGGSTPITTGFKRIAARIDENTIELVEDLGANSTGVEIESISDEWEILYKNDDVTLASMHDVAKKLENAGRDAGADDFLCEWVATGADAGFFRVTCLYRGSTRTIMSVSPPITTGVADLTAAGLPFDTFTVTAGTGTSNPFLAVDARWTRVAAPGATDGTIDETAAPVRLTRTIVGPPATFELDTIDWTARLNGDKDSNPSPSIFRDGQYVGDMGFHRGRFVIGAGEKLAFSTTNDFYNFYLEDPEAPNDADPFELSLSSDRVTLIDFIVPWRTTLTIFTRAGRQFELNDPDTFTAASASAIVTTQYPIRRARPVGISANLYFATDIGVKSGMREYYREELTLASNAADVTAHVPALMADTVRTLVAHPQTNRVFALKESSNTIYVYRAFWSGTTKQQSAWAKWTFEADTRVVDIAIIGDNLWMLVERSNEYAVEKIPLGRRDPDTGMPYAIYLDRQREILGSASAGTTTWTFPTGLVDTSINTFVQGAAFAGAGQWFNGVNVGGTRLTSAGSFTTGTCYIGRRYPAYVVLTRPYYRDQSGNPDTRRALLMRKMVVVTEPGGDYDVKITAGPRAEQTQSFRPTADYDSSGSSVQFWPLGNVEDSIIKLESTAPTPWIVSGLVRVCDLGEVCR